MGIGDSSSRWGTPAPPWKVNDRRGKSRIGGAGVPHLLILMSSPDPVKLDALSRRGRPARHRPGGDRHAHLAPETSPPPAIRTTSQTEMPMATAAQHDQR